jgi:hypothetical protein
MDDFSQFNQVYGEYFYFEHPPARTIEDVYEPYLLQAGLINRTPRGRTVTANAYRHLSYKLPMGWGEQARLELE